MKITRLPHRKEKARVRSGLFRWRLTTVHAPSITVPIRRLLLAALAALVLLPALGMALGEPRAYATAGIVLAAVWLAMAAVGLLRQRRGPGND